MQCDQNLSWAHFRYIAKNAKILYADIQVLTYIQTTRSKSIVILFIHIHVVISMPTTVWTSSKLSVILDYPYVSVHVVT